MRRGLEQFGATSRDFGTRIASLDAQKKSLLRCLIDRVVIRRTAPDSVEVRIVWRGGDTTTARVPVTVNALARLSSAPEMEETILNLGPARGRRIGRSPST